MRDEDLRKNGPPQEFDNTLLSNYCECPRALYWFLRRVDYAITPPYFTWGRAFGAGLNAFYEGDGTLRERHIEGKLAATQLWEIESPEPRTNDTIENLQRVFDDYCECYPDEPWKQKSRHGELGFQFPIPGTSFYYAGAIDAYIEWPGYGMLLREDKTTGNYLVPNYQQHWMRTSQVTGYYWALWQMLGEAPFGALINMISKRPSKSKEDQFARNLVRKSEYQVNEFMKHTVGIIDRICHEWDDWTWPKLGERIYLKCMGGVGRSPCLYNSLCLLEEDPWELDDSEITQEEYTIRADKWKPWEREGDT